MKIKVYVAGPYTRPDPCENTNRAILVANELLDVGYVPFVPHLTHFWHTVTPKPYKHWLEYDKHWVAVCDVVLRLSGESAGADEEIRLANSLGIPVVHSLDELKKRYPVADVPVTQPTPPA